MITYEDVPAVAIAAFIAPAQCWLLQRTARRPEIFAEITQTPAKATCLVFTSLELIHPAMSGQADPS